jgi:hypothetical protein
VIRDDRAGALVGQVFGAVQLDLKHSRPRPQPAIDAAHDGIDARPPCSIES